jgi:glycosyltransferase involved in cell wall biosynthesis
VRVAVNVEQLLYKTPGGIGRYTAQLVTLLPQLFPDDDVVAFTARHGVAAVEVAFRQAGLADGSARRAIRLPLPRPVLYDAWHLAGIPRLGWMAPALGSCPLIHAPSVAVPPAGRARLVVNVHDVAPLIFPETFTGRGRRFHRQGIRAAARRADLVITGSQASADELAAWTSIPADRIRVVHNGVDATRAEPEVVAETLARLRLADAPYVLWVGSLEPRKNLRTLVSAFARLPAELEGVRLAIAGPGGWLGDDLVVAADQRRLGERIRWLGRVSDADLRALYAGARIFAFPSRHEGFGLPVLEAMVQGTAVVCADIPPLREVSGGAARLVPAEDVDAWVAALSELLAGEEGIDELAAAGPPRAAEFSWERTVRATRDVYLEALA